MMKHTSVDHGASEPVKFIDKQRFSMRDLVCEKVVVFTDRAEVHRVFNTYLKKGETELIINNVSSSIDADSVRVEGRGEASVLDVVCQKKRVEKGEEHAHENIKQLQADLDALLEKRDETTKKQQRLTKQQTVFDLFAQSLAQPKAPSSHDDGAKATLASSKDHVHNFVDFLDTYEKRQETLDKQLLQVKKESEKLEEQIRVAQENLNKLRYNNATYETEVTVLVETTKDNAEAYLHISYLVYNASWIPKYDIRVFSEDKSMVINYFGLITQSTGEDWNETKLSLSTAVPSVGGNIPELTTLNIKIKPKHQPPPPPMYKRGGLLGAAAPMMMMARASTSMSDMEDAPVMAAQTMQVQKSTVGSTSTFEIPRSATIPADNNTHKVTIGILNLKPDFLYESVPRKNTHAFIKAKAVNTSNYVMLSGQANVFFENNFVAKTNIKAYSPLEEIECSLGVDPSIRIEYKPLKIFKAQSGTIFLTKTTTSTYSQTIEVKNTKTQAVKVLVSDNLPSSNDDKIQVKLLEPNLKTSPNVKINKQNNLEFDLTIEPNKTEEVLIKYTIDHPVDEEVEMF